MIRVGGLLSERIFTAASPRYKFYERINTMNTLVAYLIVIAVWATTPLGIKWSGEALPAFAAAGSRMAIAAVLGLLWLAARRCRGSP